MRCFLRRFGEKNICPALAGISAAFCASFAVIAQASMLERIGISFSSACAALFAASFAATFLLAVLRVNLVAAPNAAVSGYIVWLEIISRGKTLEAVLAACFVAFVLSLAVVVSPAGKMFLASFPRRFREAICFSLGAMLVVEGLTTGHLLIESPLTVTALGDFADPFVYVSLAGIIFTFSLLANGVRGAVFAGGAFTFFYALAGGFVAFADGFFAAPELPSATLDFAAAFAMPDVMLTLFVLFAFGNLATVEALCGDESEVVRKKIAGAVFAGGAISALLGAMPTFVAPESAIMRTEKTNESRGFAAAFGACAVFLLFVFASPFAESVGDFSAVAAPMLVVSGFFLLKTAGNVFGGPLSESAAALTMTFTAALGHDIAAAIGSSLLMYVFLQLMGGKGRETGKGAYIAAALFLLFWIL